MASLTTRQRDILKVLLQANEPISSADIAARLSISPRQVTYSLTSMRRWLVINDVQLKITPGVGVELECAPHNFEKFSKEIYSKSSLQLILSGGQRQQLLALVLLAETDEPVLLNSLQQMLQISRATVLKDLDKIDAWLSKWDVALIRRQNFGILLDAPEFKRQQVLAALLWAEDPLGEPIAEMSYAEGLSFSLKRDSALHPIVEKANAIMHSLNTRRAISQVAYAEKQLGGRFTDDAVLHLSLAFAILVYRVLRGRHIEVERDTLAWIKTLPVWDASTNIARKLEWTPACQWQEGDIAHIAMQILAAPRNESWPGYGERDQADIQMTNCLVEHICESYQLPDLCEDRTLREGLVNHIIPAYLRQRFTLWFPSQFNASLPEQYETEHRIAAELASIVKEHTQENLPPTEVNNLALLLRAAVIRTNPHRVRRVIVVCPSGMATAQLLVARLGIRFPRFGSIQVVPMRELNPTMASTADLILTTVPLPASISAHSNVIQVHPLLMPQDIDAITRFLQ
jgi:mannitol operon transcriptional antiterminator